MRSWLLTVLTFSLVASAGLCACGDSGTGPDQEPAVLTGAYLGRTPPGMTPTIFVPEQLQSNDTWFWHGALAFTPDGSELYLDLYYPSSAAGIQTRFMRIEDSVWTSIEPPSFAGNSADASPSFTPDGDKVFFISNRDNGRAYGVWTATRSAGEWSQPQPVSIPSVPSLGGGWEVSVTRDETLYLRMQDNSSNTDLDIYRSRLISGTYGVPERLGNEINSTHMDLAPYIDPDEDYLLFASARPGGVGGSDLYVSFHTAAGPWTDAINLGPAVNSSHNEGSPYVSPDGLYLFFNSDRSANHERDPYWVDAQVIEVLRPGN